MTIALERELIRDIWKNPRGVNELLILPFLFFPNLNPLNWLFKPFKWLFKFLFILLPYHVTSENCDQESNDSIGGVLPVFLTSFIISLVLSFGVVVIITNSDDNLFSAANTGRNSTFNSYSFFDDWANIILYTFVVPTYVALCIVIYYISRAFLNQKSVRKYEGSDITAKVIHGTRPKYTYGVWQIGVMVTTVLVTASLISIVYQSDVYNLLLCVDENFCNGSGEPLLYWFLTENGSSVTYNDAGIYYILLNFFLMLTIIVCILYYYASAFSVIGLKKYIDQGLYDNPEHLTLDLKIYAQLYVYAKWLFFAFIVNTYIWKESYLGNVTNVDVTLVAYAAVGSFLLPIPNYIVQTSWNLRQRKLYLSGLITKRADGFTIYPRGRILVSKNIASFLIGSFFSIGVLTLLGLEPLDFVKNAVWPD